MSTCKGCGAEIVWLDTLAGKKIPVDAEPRMVAVVDMMDASQVAVVRKAYTPHWSTCPKAKDLKSGKQKQPHNALHPTTSQNGGMATP